jgi:hypothetical protein
MKLLLLNLLIIMLIGAPLFLLEWVRSRYLWIDKHFDILNLILWFLTLVAVYIWVLPALNLQPNWHILTPY